MNKLKFISTFFIFLFISILFTVNANAYSESVDLAKKQPFTIIEGENLRICDLANLMTFKGTKNNNNSFRVVSIGNKSASSTEDVSSIQVLSTSIQGSSELNSTMKNVLVRFVSPETGQTISTTIPFITLNNEFPILNVPHIYISSTQFDAFAKSNLPLKQSFEFYLLDSVLVTDADGSVFSKQPITNEADANSCSDFFPYDISIYTMNGSTNIDINTYQKGVTAQFCITVTDLDKSVTIPCYVTFLVDDNEKEVTYDTFTRSISAKYYPYFREDIQYSDGFYFAIKKNNTFYFLNNENKILRNENGDPFPVDACLTNLIIPFDNDGKIDDGEVCKVVPMSKWVKNGNCMALLTGCLTYVESSNDDNRDYISSWTFPEKEVEIIKKSFEQSSNPDDNFYINYATNGYCKIGNKEINSAGKISSDIPILDADGKDTGLTWYINDNTLYIKAKDVASSDYSYKIPDYLLTKPLSTIYNDENHEKNGIFFLNDNNNFYDLSSYFTLSGEHERTNIPPWYGYAQSGMFNRVILDDKITSIGAYAFYNCTNITKPLNIPTNCTYIGEGAFLNCTNLTGDLQTLSVNEIDDFAFANCKELTGKLTFGLDAINTIGVGAFCNSGISKSLSFPSSLTSIGDFAFMNCINLDGRLELSSNLKYLGQYAFAGCSNLDGRLSIPVSLTEIKPFTFAGCSGFNEELDFSQSNLKVIGEYAFYGCINLTGHYNSASETIVMLPQTLTHIYTGAFKDCVNLKTTLILNENLEYIGPSAFSGCVNIITIDNSALMFKDATTQQVKEKSVKIMPTAFYIKNDVATNLVVKFLGSDNTTMTNFSTYNFLGDNRFLTND